VSDVVRPVPAPLTERESFAAPLGGAAYGDRLYKWTITGFAWCVPILLVLIAVEVAAAAWPAFRAFGLGFITSSKWDAVRGEFGGPALIQAYMREPARST